MKKKLSYFLLILGIFIMLVGCGFSAPPLSDVEIDGVKIGGITPFSASLIGVGAVIFLAGVGLYFKGK